MNRTKMNQAITKLTQAYEDQLQADRAFHYFINVVMNDANQDAEWQRNELAKQFEARHAAEDEVDRAKAQLRKLAA